jgi:hypothetical protein
MHVIDEKLVETTCLSPRIHAVYPTIYANLRFSRRGARIISQIVLDSRESLRIGEWCPHLGLFPWLF